MASRYTNSVLTPQPIRKIIPAVTDILHPLKMGERIDNLATKYYNDPTLSWLIMCANPRYANEFEIPIGVDVRIPFPLDRVYTLWKMNSQI